MRLILLALTTPLFLTACANSDENLATSSPTSAPTATATPAAAAAVIFCPQIGIGSAPTTPTPIPAGEPSSIDPGVDPPRLLLRQTEAPPLPSGLQPLSEYYLVEGGTPGYATLLSVALLSSDLGPLAWYTYDNGEWLQLPNSLVPRGPREGPVAVGEFPTLPANLIVLAAVPQ